jgi:diaminohydroxyphosphoribosylaminopyrimidine deaminase/5-amino-6-(5-phosphoribosylamino)uracil reductase
MNNEELMLRAITQAEKFKYTAKPNPMVGAILHNGEEIISEGYHEKYGDNHAEINAIANAQKYYGVKFKRFADLTLICTLEPCSHVGKTGSCAKKIVDVGIKNIVIGSIDPNPKVAGKGIKILKENNINVTVGLHEKLVKNQNKYFFYKHQNNKLFVTLKIARSFDGKSHLNSDERVFVTSESSRKDVQLIRASQDAILTGGNTLRNDNPIMNARVDFKVNQPKKILLTNKKYREDLDFFNEDFLEVFKSKDLKQILNSLSETDICSLLVEAGPKLATSFLEARCVDQIILYTSSKALGKNGVSWFKEDNAIENYGFKLESSYKIDSDTKQIYIKDE